MTRGLTPEFVSALDLVEEEIALLEARWDRMTGKQQDSAAKVLRILQRRRTCLALLLKKRREMRLGKVVDYWDYRNAGGMIAVLASENEERVA